MSNLSQFSRTIPLGGIIMWSGSTSPEGWQVCDGSDLPITSPLRKENYGSLTKTPDLRDKFIVGAGSDYSIGVTGGSNTVQLGIEHMPSHNHGGSTGDNNVGHKHVFPGDDQLDRAHGFNGWLGRDADSASGGKSVPYDAVSTVDGTVFGRMYYTGPNSANHVHGVNPQGGGLAHENRPPYYALAFIMRIA